MEGQILCYARFQDASSQVLSSAIKCYHLCFSFSFTLRCCAWLGSPPENLRGGCGRIHCGPVSWSKAHETNETVFKTCFFYPQKVCKLHKLYWNRHRCLQFHFRTKIQLFSLAWGFLSADSGEAWMHSTIPPHDTLGAFFRFARHNSLAWGAAGSDGRNQGECPGGLDYAIATFGYRVVPTLGSTSISSGQASIFKTFWSARLSWVWHHRVLHLRPRLEWWWHCVARPLQRSSIAKKVFLSP